MRKGQALVMVILVLAVVATVGLSVASRSVTEVGQSTVHEESVRALEAAEAGLEQFLAGASLTAGTLTPVSSGSDASFSLSGISNIGGGTSYKVPGRLKEGDVVTLNLEGSGAAQVSVCWGTGSANDLKRPGIIVSLYYKQGSDYMMQERVYYRSPPLGSGWFSVLPAGGGPWDCDTDTDHTFIRQIVLNSNLNGNINAQGAPLFMRVRMMYGRDASDISLEQPVAFEINTGTLPLQAGSVESVGSAGDSVQKIKAVAEDWDMPGVFDAAIFSGVSLVK